MLHPTERHIGHEILAAQAEVTKRRFLIPQPRRLTPFVKYALDLQRKSIELVPSNLTADILKKSLAYGRMTDSINSSSSLPDEAVLYMKQSVVTINTLMGNLIGINFLNGIPDPESRYPLFQERLQTDPEDFEELMKFTQPVALSLKRGVPDDQMIDLVGIAAYIYYQDAASVVDTEVESGIDTTLSTYRAIYPAAANYLQKG